MSNFDTFVKEAIDPATRGVFFTGVSAAMTFAIAAGTLIHRILVSLAKERLEFVEKKFAESSKELDELKSQFAKAISDRENQKTSYESEIKGLKERIRTITCGICGGKVKKIYHATKPSEYSTDTFEIKLECISPDCGHVIETTNHALANLSLSFQN